MRLLLNFVVCDDTVCDGAVGVLSL